MRNNGLTGINDVDLLLTQVNADLIQRPIAPGASYNQLAWCRKGGTIGQRSVFPVPFFGNKSKKRSIFEEIPGTKAEVAQFSVQSDMWGPDAEIIPALTRACDIYGLVENNLPTILAQAGIELDRQMAELIGLGVSTIVDYDGKNYFATDHLCNPNRPSLKTFSNYKTNRACNAAGITATLEDLAIMPGPDGNLLSMPGKLVIFTSTEAQYITAADLMNGTLIANAAGTATQSNVGLRGRADVINLPALREYGSAKYWGIAKIVTDKHRPFVMDQPIPLQAYIEGLGINEHTQATYSIAKQGVQDAHGFGYLWPQLCVLCVEP